MVEVVVPLLFGFIGAFAGSMCGVYLVLRLLHLQREEVQQQVVQEVQQYQPQEDEEYGDARDINYFLNSTVVRRWWLGPGSVPPQKRGEE